MAEKQNNFPLPSAFGTVSRMIDIGGMCIPLYSGINWHKDEPIDEAQTEPVEAAPEE